jgi:hypothetical protein
MERHPMIMDWQKQYCENVCITETNLYVQYNPYQNSNDILHRDKKVNHKVQMGPKKTLNSKSNPKLKEQS